MRACTCVCARADATTRDMTRDFHDTINVRGAARQGGPAPPYYFLFLWAALKIACCVYVRTYVGASVKLCTIFNHS